MKQTNSYQKFFDQMFWLFAGGGIICIAVGLYQTVHFVTWPEVEATIDSVDYKCRAIKKEWWQKHGTTELYPCVDVETGERLSNQGYTKRGARTLTFVVEFQTLDGQNIKTTIADLEQDLSKSDNIGKTLIRYSRFTPENAEFSDITYNMMRDFLLMGVVGLVLALGSRKILKAL